MNEESARPENTATNAAPTRRGSLDVLVVEDNPVNQKLVVALLTKWGHRALVACDGSRCLEALERQSFDLVLMDVQMPGMDGIEATRSIRAREHEVGGHIRIIGISAHAGVQDHARSLEAGMDQYLTKPLDSRLLRNAIADMIPALGTEPIDPKGAAVGPVDFELLKEFVGDDPALLAEVIQIFLEDSPITLEKVACAISAADSQAVEKSAHRLKGGLSTMGAATAAETASLLEGLARDGVLAGAAALCDRLGREVEAVSWSLRLWKDQLAV